MNPLLMTVLVLFSSADGKLAETTAPFCSALLPEASRFFTMDSTFY